ncbi:MAG TPA: KamA family radical SAM protein [Polyangiaceae bacterium]|nr:KamA family radical SAM protein [Polyangiaceae bacterium]
MSASLPVLPVSSAVVAQKPPAPPSALAHRELRRGTWWHAIPAYRQIDEATFLDHTWQARSSITKVSRLVETIQDLVPSGFVEDLEAGMKRAPMSVRVSPYIVSLIDWEHPYDDPLRVQFFPVASRLLADHPKLGLDSLAEQADAPVAGLTHRYTDKALFLPLDTCPVYCRFCTRSYAIGLDTDEVEKVHLRPNDERWRRAYQYIASRPELEDIVISGGDAYQLRAAHIEEIGDALLAIPHVRRMRFATKGPAVMPMKILTDSAWVDALTRVVEKGRRMRKDVVLHTHFNNPNEITAITEAAMGRLFERGVVVRNQSVLIRGVNDSVDTMTLLVKRLGHLNVHAYYVYVHDMVRGVEDLRTSVDTAIHIEKHVRGATAGFNTPTFVVDAPGGGGKRDAHSYEYYDRDTGISVYSAPSVKLGRFFTYFDPLHQLATHQQRRWSDPAEQQAMIDEALSKARGRAR